MLISKTAIAIGLILLSGCKKLPDSKLSSLENFTYGSGRLRTNECGPPPNVKVPYMDLVNKVTIDPVGAEEAAVRQVLSAVPPGMIQFLIDSRTIIHVDNEAPSKCVALIASGGTISDRAQKSIKYQSMEACALQGMRPGDEIGKGPAGSYYSLPPIDIYVKRDPGVIKHELLRQIGGSFFTHYGMLERSVDKSGRAIFLPGGQQRPDIALASERLVHAYLRDVANSKFFTMKMLDVYLGPGAGEVLSKQMLDASVTKIPIERRYSSVLKQERKNLSEVEFRALIATFDTMVALEAFDSYYCNSFGTFVVEDVEKLVLGTYADEAEAKSILSRQQNSYKIMRALFPLAFDVFEREMVPAIHRMDRIWHAKNVRAKAPSSALGLVETPAGSQVAGKPATNEELERARGWLSKSQQSSAETGARTAALGWVVDDAYEARDRKVLLNQAIALRYMQRRYDEVEPLVHNKLNEVSAINDTTFVLQSALKGRDNLSDAEKAKLFSSAPARVQNPFLPGVNERSGNPFASMINSQANQAPVDPRRFGSDEKMAFANIRALNGDGNLNPEERRNVQNELVRQMARKEVVWQQIQDIEQPLFDQHKQLMSSVKQGITESLPEWQADFAKDFSGSVQQKQNMLRDKGFGYAAEGLDQRAKDALLSGKPVFDEASLKPLLDRNLEPDSRYNVDRMLQDRKSGVPLYLSTEVNMRKLYEDMEYRNKAAYNDPVIGMGEASKELRLANVKYVESVSDVVGGTEIPIVAQIGDAVSFGTSAYTAGVTGEAKDVVKMGTSAVAFVPFGTALKQAGKHADEAGQSIVSGAGIFNKRFASDVASGGVKAQLAASAVQGSYTLGSMVMSSDERQPDPNADRLRQEYVAAFGESPKADSAIGIVNQAKVEAEVRQSEQAEQAAVQEQSVQPVVQEQSTQPAAKETK